MDVDKIIAAIPGRSDAERGRMRANAERCIADGPEKMRAAAQQVIDALEQQALDEAASFADRINDMGPTDRLVAAFTAMPPTKMETKVLEALVNHPQSTPQELSVVCGWQGRTWQKRLETLYAKRAVYLSPSDAGVEKPVGIGFELLASQDPADECFAMRPEAIEALASLKLIKASAAKAAASKAA